MQSSTCDRKRRLPNLRMSERPKLLKVCAIESTAWLLLRTQMEALRDHGWDVHIACSDGPYMPAPPKLGFTPHPIPIARNTNTFAHAKSIWQLYRLIGHQ